MFLTDSDEDADKVRKWSAQSREEAAWYQIARKAQSSIKNVRSDINSAAFYVRIIPSAPISLDGYERIHLIFEGSYSAEKDNL